MTAIETTEIVFPSRGKLYDGKMHDGKTEIRAWTTAEIKLLVSARKAGSREKLEKALDRVIDNCLIMPGGMKPDELLYTDGFFALIAQRILTYSPHFKSEFKCSNCNFRNQMWIDLMNDLSETVIKSDVKEPLEVFLPKLNHPVELRLLRRRDSQKVSKYSKTKLEKAPLAGELGDPGYSYRVALQIETIDSEKVNLGQRVVWVDGLHAQDLMAIENALENAASGVDPVITKPCQHPSCGEETRFILPMNLEFFRPRSTRPEADSRDAG